MLDQDVSCIMVAKRKHIEKGVPMAKRYLRKIVRLLQFATW